MLMQMRSTDQWQAVKEDAGEQKEKEQISLVLECLAEEEFLSLICNVGKQREDSF